MIRTLYSLLMWVAQPLLRCKLARRGVQEPGYLQAVEERFGRYAMPPSAGWFWIHAVSLGETRAAAVLIAGLRVRLPGMRLLLTHGTATGREEGAALLQTGDCQVWQPWDTPAAVERFLRHFRPRIGILMETEIWPNLVHGCAQAGLPLVLANARMSEKSQRQAQRLAWLSRPALGTLTAVWAQTPADALRFAQLGGAMPSVFGNLKFDAKPDAEQLAQGQSWRQNRTRPVVLLASSRDGEEAQLLKILQSPQSHEQENGAVQWLIVPRHPQRFEEVAALCMQHGFTVSRRSSWAESPAAAAAAGTLWLGDSLGEMALYYGMADLALLGGSFEALGGQNLIEAAACGCPVLMGPHTFNFLEAAELAQAAGAARRVTSMAHAVVQALALVREPQQRQAMAEAASGFAKAHRGATEKTAAAVLALVQQGVDSL